MRTASSASFSQRALSVITASMVMLSGLVLTAGSANAAETETIPYTYVVKVPVTVTVWEYQVVKTKVNGRTVVKYEKVAKTKTEYRNETRTGYRTAPIKAADKPAASEFKVEVARDAAFSSKVKEIKITPASAGANKVNLSSQLSGNVGDVAYVRVIAKNAAGKSTAGKAAKITFGKVSERTEGYSYQYSETYVSRAGYWDTVTDYSNPQYRSRWVDTSYTEYWVETQAYTAYRTESYRVQTSTKRVFSHNETYVSGYRSESYRSGTGRRQYSYECGYYQYVWKVPRYISKTCYGWEEYPIYSTRSVPVYSTRAVYDEIPIYETRYREVAYTAYRDVNRSRVVSDGYWTSDHIGYGTKQVYVDPAYATRTATGYATRQVDVNGWKAAN